MNRFHVVVPSLPGFGFSSPAPSGWTLNNTADLFDTLLTEVLGYKTYAAVGGDWMGPSLDNLHSNPNFANQAATLGDAEKQRIQSNVIFPTDGWGYFLEQSTRPATIGLALLDNPVGQLSWMGEKYLSGMLMHSIWKELGRDDNAHNLGDPLMGTPPSTLNNNTIMTSVSLYYLTCTFETSINTYYQNPNEFAPVMRRATNDIPMGFASYRYEAQYDPPR
ncbi:hypothetical protein FRC11_004830 [Ceratobasidium sp. 423]|nr:hypothetical protein FRC11_004830 [Ceratobasidium sp. 423]